MTRGLEQRRWDDAPNLVQVGRHYPHAPIVEAVIEIRCELPSSTTLEHLSQVVNSDEFPTVEKAINIINTVEVRDDGITSGASGEHVGHVFRGTDGRRVVQSRLNGFSYAWMAPYSDWESVSSEAEAFWLRYREAANPRRTTRLGVRYVNKIEIATPLVEVKDYLRTAIDVSPYLPQAMHGFFFQVNVPLTRYGALATITSTSAHSDKPNSTALVLDIDASQQVALDLVDGASGADIRARLETLRHAKNYVFEACITDATRRLIE